MSFGLYILGFAILIIGLAMGAHLAHMPTRWITVGVVVMVGIGIVKGVGSARRPDPSPASEARMGRHQSVRGRPRARA